MSGAIEWTPDGKCAVIDVDLKPGTSIDLSKCYKGLGVGKCWI